jgi:filamentous hemagglutinin
MKSFKQIKNYISNFVEFEADMIVEKGAKLNLGKIAPQGKYHGGADQVLMPLNYPENWVKTIKDLKTGKVYTLDEFKIAFPDLIGR